MRIITYELQEYEPGQRLKHCKARWKFEPGNKRLALSVLKQAQKDQPEKHFRLVRVEESYTAKIVCDKRRTLID